MIIYLLQDIAIVNVSKNIADMTGSGMLYIIIWLQLTASAYGNHRDFSPLSQYNLRPWLSNLGPCNIL